MYFASLNQLARMPPRIECEASEKTRTDCYVRASSGLPTKDEIKKSTFLRFLEERLISSLIRNFSFREDLEITKAMNLRFFRQQIPKESDY